METPRRWVSIRMKRREKKRLQDFCTVRKVIFDLQKVRSCFSTHVNSAKCLHFCDTTGNQRKQRKHKSYWFSWPTGFKNPLYFLAQRTKVLKSSSLNTSGYLWWHVLGCIRCFCPHQIVCYFKIFRLAMGLTVQGSNPCRSRSSAPIWTVPRAPPSVPYNGYRIPFPRVKMAGTWLCDHHPIYRQG
jgi:hypothetical protein